MPSPKRRRRPVDANDELPPPSPEPASAPAPAAHLNLVCPNCRRESLSTFVPLAELPEGTLLECTRRPGCNAAFEVRKGTLVKVG